MSQNKFTLLLNLRKDNFSNLDFNIILQIILQIKLALHPDKKAHSLAYIFILLVVNGYERGLNKRNDRLTGFPLFWVTPAPRI